MPRTLPGRQAARWPPASPNTRQWPAVTALITAFVLGVAVAFGIWAVASQPSSSERNVEQMQRAEVERDLKLVAELTDLARGSRDRLAQTLSGMAAVAPFGTATPGTPLSADSVKGWREAVTAEVNRYAEPPSAGTAVNVARGGLQAAVQQLASAVDLFEAAATAPQPLSGKLIGNAGTQRTLALRTWSVAAIQLDQINIDAGYGHVHVQLPAAPGSGVISSDGSPEGSGRK
jgi:hypothetical protein